MLNSVNQVIIYEDEDEAALKAEFVRLMALYSDRNSPYELARHLFKDLREPESRAAQAATAWANDIEIKETIHEYKLYGPNKSTETTELENLIAVAKSIYEDVAVSAKDRVAAIETHAKLRGLLIKQIDKTTTDKTPVKLPVFNFAIYPDD